MRKLLSIFAFSLVTVLALPSCTQNNSAIGNWNTINKNFIIYPGEFSKLNFTIIQTAIPLKYDKYIGLIKSGDYQVILRGKKRYLLKWPVKENNLTTQDNAAKERIINNNLYLLQPKSNLIPPFNKNLIHYLPKEIDTGHIIYDQDNVPLKFYQYFSLLFNSRAALRHDENGKFIWRFPNQGYITGVPITLHTSQDTGRRLQYIYTQLSQADKVLVIKSKHELCLQRAEKTFMSFHCEFGKNPVGDKEREGDGRTPEGFYSLVGFTANGKYGKAFLTSYPDSLHIALAKSKGVSPGEQIMIHGTSQARSNLKNWTNGCIALSNTDMDSLLDYVILGTPIEIRK